MSVNDEGLDNRVLQEIHALLDGSVTTTALRPCPVARLMGTLNEETSLIVRRLLDSTQSTRRIHLALGRAGVRIGRDTLDDHRKRWCTCGENT